MSAIQTYHLRCDASGCTAVYTSTVHSPTTSVVRIEARAEGWSHTAEAQGRSWPRSVDYCPTHTKERAS